MVMLFDDIKLKCFIELIYLKYTLFQAPVAKTNVVKSAPKASKAGKR